MSAYYIILIHNIIIIRVIKNVLDLIKLIPPTQNIIILCYKLVKQKLKIYLLK